MNFCDLTLSTPEENLACDEVLLDWCEATGGPEILRLWEPDKYFVVLGYGNQAATEASLESCRRQGIPILRRCSGGGTVLQGPGCLNYALVLRTDYARGLDSISGANDFIMGRHQDFFASHLDAPVKRQGHTDLAIGGLKFNGNAQRRHKDFLLFHGCFLLNLDIGLMEQVLPLPSRQPEYRSRRSHSDFLLNLKRPVAALKTGLARLWNADVALTGIPTDKVATLAREKYSRDEWNLKF